MTETKRERLDRLTRAAHREANAGRRPSIHEVSVTLRLEPVGWAEARRRGRAHARALDGQPRWPEPEKTKRTTEPRPESTRKPERRLGRWFSRDRWWKVTSRALRKMRLERERAIADAIAKEKQ